MGRYKKNKSINDLIVEENLNENARDLLKNRFREDSRDFIRKTRLYDLVTLNYRGSIKY